MTTTPVPDLLKIARAVDGDDWFVARIKVACRLAGQPFTDACALAVATAVQDSIQVDEHKTVDTSGVSDEAIIAAVGAHYMRTPSPEA